MCVSRCTCEFSCPRSQKRVQSPSCELPSLGAGNQTWVQCKNDGRSLNAESALLPHVHSTFYELTWTFFFPRFCLF